MKRLILSIIWLFVVAGFGVAAGPKPIILHPDYNHDKYGTEPVEIKREFRAYTLSFDGDDDDDRDGESDYLRIPQWVAYQMQACPDLPSAPDRPDWFSDNELVEACIASKDDSYRYSRPWRKENPTWNYNRGHMCRKKHAWRLGADADWNTHTMLNACPQQADLNQGIWLDMEKKTDQWADKYGEVWIVCGPIIYGGKPIRYYGETEKGELLVAIPDAFFKIVIREVEGESVPKVLALLYPQRGYDYRGIEGEYDHLPYLVSVDKIEAFTGLDFLTALDDDVEAEVEKVTATALWE